MQASQLNIVAHFPDSFTSIADLESRYESREGLIKAKLALAESILRLVETGHRSKSVDHAEALTLCQNEVASLRDAMDTLNIERQDAITKLHNTESWKFETIDDLCSYYEILYLEKWAAINVNATAEEGEHMFALVQDMVLGLLGVVENFKEGQVGFIERRRASMRMGGIIIDMIRDADKFVEL